MEAVSPTKARLHTKNIYFFLIFSLRIYQPDREAGYSFPIGVAGVIHVIHVGSCCTEVDLKNYKKIQRKKIPTHPQRQNQWWRFLLWRELPLKMCMLVFSRLSNNFHVINHQRKVSIPIFLCYQSPTESLSLFSWTIYISGTWSLSWRRRISALSCEIT